MGDIEDVVAYVRRHSGIDPVRGEALAARLERPLDPDELVSAADALARDEGAGEGSGRDEVIRLLARLFGYHPPSSPAIAEAHERARGLVLEVAVALWDVVPPCPERDRMLVRLDEALMLANAAIARQQQVGEG